MITKVYNIMKTRKSIYETPLVHVEAFSAESGFAASLRTGIPDITGDYVKDQSEEWNL